MSFYGLHADALMAAHIFEEAYNIVVHNGEREYGGKGKPQSIIDYRCAPFQPSTDTACASGTEFWTAVHGACDTALGCVPGRRDTAGGARPA